MRGCATQSLESQVGASAACSPASLLRLQAKLQVFILNFHRGALKSLDLPMNKQELLADAIRSGRIAEVQRALDQGSSLDEPIGSTIPLVLAIENGEQDVAVYLVQRGADLSLAPLRKPSSVEVEQADKSALREIEYLERALILVSNIVNQFALEEMCFALEQSRRDSGVLKSAMGLAASQTLFGFWSRDLIGGLLNATFCGNLKNEFIAYLYHIPLHFFIYVLTTTWNTFDTAHRAVGMPRKLQAAIWRMAWNLVWGVEAATCIFFYLLIYEALKEFLKRMAARLWSRPEPASKTRYPGNKILQALLDRKWMQKSVLLALIENDIFSPEYIEELTRNEDHGNWEFVRLWEQVIRTGQTESLQLLLLLGVPHEYTWPTGHDRPTPFELAISSGNNHGALILGSLIEGTKDSAHQMNKALPMASRCSNQRGGQATRSQRAVFDMILKHATDVNTADEMGRTALSHAVEHGSSLLVDKLIARGAHVDIADRNEMTPLFHLRADKQPTEMLRKLAENGANVNHPDARGKTPLHHHVEYPVEFVKSLLAAGADPNMMSKDGTTALDHVSRYGPEENVHALLEAGARLDLGEPLIRACNRKYRRAAVLRLLLEHGANSRVVDVDGKTPLHIVLHEPSRAEKADGEDRDNLHSVEVLIEFGADVHTACRIWRGGYEVTALGIAAERAHGRQGQLILIALLGAGASSQGIGEHGLPAIVSVCRRSPRLESSQEDQDNLRLFLNSGVDLRYRDKTSGKTLLHHASENSNYLALKLLLEKGFSVDTTDDFRRTLLHMACTNRYWMTMEQSLKYEAAGRYPGSEQYARYHCSRESSVTLTLLMDWGAKFDSCDVHGCTPAHIAAKAGNPRIMAILLPCSGATLLYDSPDIKGRNILHYAVNSPETTRVLLSYHHSGNALAEQYFMASELLENTNVMLQKLSGTFTKQIATRLQAHTPHRWDDKFGNTPLHYAALMGNADVVAQYLAQPDFDACAVNNDGESPLDYATEHRDCALAIAAKLAELGAPVHPTEPGYPLSKSRTAAEMFVRALRKKYKYGVYPTG